MKKCLVITQVFPSGLTGTTVKTRETITVLLQNGYKVDVCCIQPEKLITNSFSHPNLLFHIIAKKSVMSKFTLEYILRVFFILFTVLPFRVKKMYDRRLHSTIMKLRSKNKYDFVFFDGFSTLQYADKFDAKNIYIDDEDITKLVYERSKTERNILLRMFFLLEFLRCGIYERKFLKRVGHIWAINKETAKRLAVLSTAKTVVMPTIVSKQKNVFSKKSKNIVFTGLLSWLENINGIVWFLENCWDTISREYPDTKLQIVGQLPDQRIIDEAAKHSNVNILGYVENLEDVYKKAAIAIAPIFINVGIKVKIVTYLSYGLPVISTKRATLGLASNEGVSIAGTPSAFIKKCRQLLESTEKRTSLSKKAYSNYQNNHSAQCLTAFLRSNGVV